MKLISDNSIITDATGKRYFVERWGINGIVMEERHIPVPEVKIVRVFNENGTEDETRRSESPDPALMALNDKVFDGKTGEWVTATRHPEGGE